MKTLVMKFGGAAVATPQHFSRIADIILERKKHYPKIAVVVSAMGSTTNDLISLAKEVNPTPPTREYDMLVSVGERISISLLAMALAAKGHRAVSFTGSQSGIITCGNHTQASIVDVRPHRLMPILEAGSVAIVAGFQGVSRNGEITTLGRGGSDTSAVALGIALQAEKVQFYKDVAGIYSEDPKKDPSAQLFKTMTYDEAYRLATSGAKILHSRSINLARKNGILLHVQSFDEQVSSTHEGTLITNENFCRQSLPVYEEGE